MRARGVPATAAAWALVLAALLPACAGLNFQHVRSGTAPDVRGSRGLKPGESTLTDCLALLGAPVAVERDQNAGGRVLTWEWEHVHGWGFFVSVPLSDLVAASIDYDRMGRDPDRLRLIFDDNWVLIERVED
jgi:hypothetical protein